MKFIQKRLSSYPVLAAVGIEPFGEMFRGLDQQELPVAVVDGSSQLGEGAGEVFEQVNNEPLILHVITKLCAAPKVSWDAPCWSETALLKRFVFSKGKDIYTFI